MLGLVANMSANIVRASPGGAPLGRGVSAGVPPLQFSYSVSANAVRFQFYEAVVIDLDSIRSNAWGVYCYNVFSGENNPVIDAQMDGDEILEVSFSDDLNTAPLVIPYTFGAIRNNFGATLPAGDLLPWAFVKCVLIPQTDANAVQVQFDRDVSVVTFEPGMFYTQMGNEIIGVSASGGIVNLTFLTDLAPGDLIAFYGAFANSSNVFCVMPFKLHYELPA